MKILCLILMTSLISCNVINQKEPVTNCINDISIERNLSVGLSTITLSLTINDSLFNLFEKKEIYSAKLLSNNLDLYGDKKIISFSRPDLENIKRNNISLIFFTTPNFVLNQHECDSLENLMKNDLRVCLFGESGKKLIIEFCKLKQYD